MHEGKALICDDDAFLRSMVGQLLTDQGWEVVAAVETAVEAINLTRILHPDLVVIDVSLRGMSGVDAIPELVEAGAAVVVCTAFSGVSDHALHAGAMAVVDKSDLAALVGVLAAIPTKSNA
jgi:two-component system chemotaxis response regulator CheY